jgi:sugar (pentulose or hexulose) kinase
MAEAPYLMGIDFGTGGVRVGLFDRQGSPAVFHAVELPTHHPRPGWAEHSVDATASTVVATDADGRHLRPAIMWMDVRAADQARRVQETGDPALKCNGFGAVSAELDLPKAMWLKEHEPETWNGAARVGDCADWAIQRLTGEAATSVNTASGKYYDDRDEGGFPAGLLYPATRDVMHQVTSHVAGAAGASGG